MTTIGRIVENRKLPGILIVDRKMQLLNINMETRQLLDTINGSESTPSDSPPKIPDEIRCLLEVSKETYDGATEIIRGEDHYLVRVTMLSRASKADGDEDSSYVMVIIEKCVLERRLDFSRKIDEFKLTRREAEVVENIISGQTNQQISAELFISEHTVKDHIRNIMQKMSVRNRTSIIRKVYT